MTRLDFRKTVVIGRAERLWKLFGFSSPDELVLEDVALARGVIVTEGPLDSMEARLVRQGTRGLIRVKAGLPETGRKRFAIAHELGHWELHEDVSQLFACTGDDMAASYKTNIHEAEANYFASGLLMPRFLFMERVLGTRFSLGTLSDLAGFFGTSLTATAIAYVDTSDECLAVVAAQEGRIRWWRASTCFEDRFWLKAGARLSAHTVAAELPSGSRAQAPPEEVDMEAWSERGHKPGSDTFIEESMYMVQYGQVLTLLQLP
jgi:hypothetical protein